MLGNEISQMLRQGTRGIIVGKNIPHLSSIYLHFNKKYHVTNYSYLLQTFTVYWKSQSSIPFCTVLKCHNYFNSLGMCFETSENSSTLQLVCGPSF